MSGDTNEDGEIRSVFQFNFSGQSSEYSSLKIRKHICLEMNTHHQHFSTLFLLTMIHDTEECGQLIETTSSQLSTRLSAESSWVTEQDQRFGWKTSTDLRLLNPKLREMRMIYNILPITLQAMRQFIWMWIIKLCRHSASSLAHFTIWTKMKSDLTWDSSSCHNVCKLSSKSIYPFFPLLGALQLWRAKSEFFVMLNVKEKFRFCWPWL